MLRDRFLMFFMSTDSYDGTRDPLGDINPVCYSSWQVPSKSGVKPQIVGPMVWPIPRGDSQVAPSTPSVQDPTICQLCWHDIAHPRAAHRERCSPSPTLLLSAYGGVVEALALTSQASWTQSCGAQSPLHRGLLLIQFLFSLLHGGTSCPWKQRSVVCQRTSPWRGLLVVFMPFCCRIG